MVGVLPRYSAHLLHRRLDRALARRLVSPGSSEAASAAAASTVACQVRKSLAVRSSSSGR